MSMLFGMATRKVTITIDEHDLATMKAMVAAGKARSVSAFVQHAIRVSLDDVVQWETELALALAATGGPLTGDERRWADMILDGKLPDA